MNAFLPPLAAGATRLGLIIGVPFMGFLTEYREQYAAKLGVRANTFDALFSHLEGRRVECIVETGCLRKQGNWQGDGQSSYLFDRYAVANNCMFWTCDNDVVAIAAARQSCSPRTQTVLNDSVSFLANFPCTIDVLYLDSFDLDKANPEPASRHHLFELCAAQRRLRSGSLVMVDDTWREGGASKGKGALVAEFMERIDAKLLTQGYQDLWLIP